MHKYRTHKCDELRHDNVKDVVKLSGWVHRKRDHGQLIFIDLRDHYGLTQVVVDSSNDNFSIIENLTLESVITITGIVVQRSSDTINKSLPTGQVVSEKSTGASYGNAFLAALAVGAVSQRDITRWNPPLSKIKTQHSKLHAEKNKLFRQLYENSKEIAHAVADST